MSGKHTGIFKLLDDGGTVQFRRFHGSLAIHSIEGAGEEDLEALESVWNAVWNLLARLLLVVFGSCSLLRGARLSRCFLWRSWLVVFVVIVQILLSNARRPEMYVSRRIKETG